MIPASDSPISNPEISNSQPSNSPTPPSPDLAPWRSPLSRALHRNRSLIYARYLQLATVRPDGSPANRTVVFRGFRDRTDWLTVITDSRSEKMPQLATNPRAEACWYFPKTREQFRIAGTLRAVLATTPDPTEQAERSRLWQNLSDAARLQFAWPNPRGDRTVDPAAFAPPPPNPIAPLETFVLLWLIPERVDWLELKGEPQNRTGFDRTPDGWQTHALNP
ncbi:pyridoxamine 5'-phosphate oxidase family protein [Limnothrix sp. FACHB-708]|nr:pyridoxamine 5'-phosphate oxidase family protein [Limnothrix sp. FACHB-708]MBD2592664.1 pyridoxamine 5'-phosphate oxidase family protein [Limnothrix sp. FACHB-406]